MQKAKGNAMKKAIGVFGSAVGGSSDENVRKARALGRAIASKGCVLVTGACTGLPLEAALAAKRAGGLVVGFSPAGSQREHLGKYKYPLEGFDFIAYPGSGYKGRNVIAVRSCDAAVFIAGGMGTLNEFTIAFDEGKRIGILTGSGGITDMVADIAKKAIRDTGASVIYDDDPGRLLQKLLKSG
ncbi:MAG: hypothetical protein JXC85_03155 [Candidatus Aenigmarchaeota archaeon]|nr:hypothetical protein [Candidatus Aenigmarchaeota archaeon]